MQQLMLLFLRHVLPTQGVYCAVAYRRKKVVAQYFLNSLEELANKLIEIDNSGLTAFYACSSYPLGCDKRTKEKALFMKSFWGDLDVDPENPEKYATQEEAVRDLLRWCKLRGLPWPTIVSSGYGVHFYWTLLEDIVKLKWQPAADRLKQQMLADGIKLDRSRTADPASVLRPVGTFNKKRKSTPKPVVVMGTGKMAAAINYQVIASALGVRAIPEFLKGIPAGENVDLGDMGVYDGPPSDANIMASKCMFIGNGRALKGKIDYTNWWLFIGAISFCQDGEKLAHEWSKGHSDYTPSETNFRLSEWGRASGPPTCERISHNNPNICSNCPHYGEITTPVRLGVVHKELEPVVIGGVEVKTPAGFKRTQHGLMRKSSSDDVDDVCFFDRDLYIKDIIENAEGYHEAVVVWDKPLVGKTEFNIRTSEFTDSRVMSRLFAEKSVFLIGRSNVEHMMIYCTSYMRDLQKAKKSVQGHINMGWKPDGSFVLGQTIVEPDGTMHTNPAVAQGIQVAKDIHTLGSLDAWKQAMSILAHSHMYRHSFALMCGFAAPLLELAGIEGAMVNLVGRTGTGKSSMQRAINSIFGHPKKLLMNAKDTEKSKLGRMGQLNNIAACIDEMGNETPEALSSLIIKSTQGSDVRRLTQSGTERETKEWCTVVITSSNHTFHSKLNHYKMDADAEKMRLLEYEIKPTSVFQNKEQAAEFNRAVLQNYGHAGVEFIQYLVKNRSTVAALIEKCRSMLPMLGIQFKSEERYWEAITVCALAGGLVAKQLNLIEFNPLEVVKSMSHEIGASQAQVSDDRFNPLDVLADYVNENIRNILRVTRDDIGVDFNRTQYNIFNLVGRIDIQKVNGATVKAELFLSKNPFVTYLLRKFLDYNQFKEAMYDLGIDIPSQRKQLTTSADLGSLTSTRANTIIFDLLDPNLGLSPDSLPPEDGQINIDDSTQLEPVKQIH